ncbi:MAG: hypothetical protein RIC89_11210, partial [Pseudomonadales bacterium]
FTSATAMPLLAEPTDSAPAYGFESYTDLSDLGFDAFIGVTRLWWKKREAGFAHKGSVADYALTDLGADFDIALTSTLELNGGFARVESQGLEQRSVARLQAGYQLRCVRSDIGCWRLDVEARYENNERGQFPLYPWQNPLSENLLTFGSRLSVPLTEAATVYIQAQVGSESDDDPRDGTFNAGDGIALGMNNRLSDRWATSLEGRVGDTGSALIGGVDYSAGPRASFNVASGVGSAATTQFTSRYRLLEGHEIYGSYSIDPDRSYGDRNVLTFGQRRDAGRRTAIFTESQFGHSDRHASTGHAFGVEHQLDEAWTFSSLIQASEADYLAQKYARRAWSFGATYSNENINFSSRVEAREDDSDSHHVRQYVVSNALRWAPTPAHRLMAKFNGALIDDDADPLDLGRFVELDLAFAYRPIETDEVNFLTRYAFLYDVGTEGQSDAPGDEKSHLVSAEGVFDLFQKSVQPQLGQPRRLTQQEFSLGARVAGRRGVHRIKKGVGPWYDVNLAMLSVRGTYKFALPHRSRFCPANADSADAESNSGDPAQNARCEPHEVIDTLFDNFEILAEYRWLKDWEGESSNEGVLLGLFKTFESRHRNAKLSNTIRVGVGYNFSGFDDNLRNTGYKADGWFVDLVAAF